MDWLTAGEALKRLKVRPQSLYAYVSRGRIEARPDPADPRRSLYAAEDVDRLAARGARPRKAADVAAQSIAWGEPVMVSALTTIARGRLIYRGRDAINLSETATLEEVAALLWGAFRAPVDSADPPAGGLRARLFAALAERAARDPATRGRAGPVLAEEAASVFAAFVSAAAGGVGAGPAHMRMARAWGVGAQGDLIRRALVLLADHELNASTFAARVAASTGAPLAACALAGLSTLAGPLHGLAVARVVKFVDEALRVGAEEAVAHRLAQGRDVPGFGHPLYPEGDPRAASLFAHMRAPAYVEAIARAAHARAGVKPNVDFAVASMAFALDLPREAPFALFAVGRSVGWLAHAIEQAESGRLIRPRARYVGPPPEAA